MKEDINLKGDGMKTLLTCSFVCMLAFVLGAEEKSKTVNSMCPLQPSKEVNASKTSTFTVEFCCDNCKGKFDKDPAKFAKDLSKAEKGKCLLTGNAATKKTDLEVGFCCGSCKGKFDKDPTNYISKVKFDVKK